MEWNGIESQRMLSMLTILFGWWKRTGDTHRPGNFHYSISALAHFLNELHIIITLLENARKRALSFIFIVAASQGCSLLDGFEDRIVVHRTGRIPYFLPPLGTRTHGTKYRPNKCVFIVPDSRRQGSQDPKPFWRTGEETLLVPSSYPQRCLLCIHSSLSRR